MSLTGGFETLAANRASKGGVQADNRHSGGCAQSFPRLMKQRRLKNAQIPSQQGNRATVTLPSTLGGYILRPFLEEPKW